MKNIVLGVTGSIAAYKAADIANTLTKEGCSVHVIMTKAGTQFISPLTFQTLTKNKVHTDMFADYDPSVVEHISLAQRADLAVIAPASANIIAKLAGGIADDMLSSVMLAYSTKPAIICPAMNTDMYENPITQRNIGILREYGYGIVEPREGRLACGSVGKGALAETETILNAIREALKGC